MLTPPPLLVLLLSHPVLWKAQAGSLRSTANEAYRRWVQYQAQCQEALAAAEPLAGLACNGTFDMYACWPHAPPNTTASAPCPWYLPWYQEVTMGSVLRLCEADGQWGSWRDHSQCVSPEKEHVFQGQRFILEKLQVVYTVGYSFSLAALLLAVLILSTFRKLRCTRNYIHMNLFISFVFRAAAILTRDKLLPTLGLHTEDPSQALATCRVAQTVTQYCVSANHTWLLVEGVYLYSLLALMAFSEDRHFKCYLFLGWGGPALFVIPWVISRHLHENTQCWERNEIKAIWWIIRMPILATILVNFLIFVRILGILLAKLKAHQMRCQDYRLRLARSTLTLVPLLGIHEVVFAPVIEEQAEGALRYTKLCFEILLSSFQGLFVSILYCFINKEVQAEIRKQWQRCQLVQSLLDERRLSLDRHSSSHGAAPCLSICSRGLGEEGEEASPASESSC
ncbi:gastric inhibitory polypeptide receptor [Phascolarctos cinereus]|uniref:Gastric inhibitory polypeptide receptor isoform X1 n=1 Tax=Phascolarctos cinereus TaxID=38626 RepID=A0A6P5JQ27_PHACI|nr:gastric inhibitory polypeptide receptor isoform X1 [Phascolarctos cinereus]XP_020835438.1 gastric inhibitory polypeptide receptor isoform X1 [Phascolarctos cinereus]